MKELFEDINDIELDAGSNYPKDNTDVLIYDKQPILLSQEGKQALIDQMENHSNFNGKKPSEVLPKYMDGYFWKLLPYGSEFGRDYECLISKNDEVNSSYDDDVVFAFGVDRTDLWKVMDLNEDVDLDLETSDVYQINDHDIYISDRVKNKILDVLGINKEELPNHSPWATRLEYDGIKFLSWLDKENIQGQWYMTNRLNWEGNLIIYKKNDPSPDGLSSGSGVLDIYRDSVDLFLDKIGYTKESIGLQEDLELEPAKDSRKDVRSQTSNRYGYEHKIYYVKGKDIETKKLIIEALENSDDYLGGDILNLKKEGIDSNAMWRIKTIDFLHDDTKAYIEFTDHRYNGGNNEYCTHHFDFDIIKPILKINEDLELDSYTPNINQIGGTLFLKDEQVKQIFENPIFRQYEVYHTIYTNCLHLDMTTGDYKDYFVAISYDKSESNYTSEECYLITLVSKDDSREFGLGYNEGNAYVTNILLKEIGLTDADLEYIKDYTGASLSEDLDLETTDGNKELIRHGVAISKDEIDGFYDEYYIETDDDTTYDLYLTANERDTDHDYDDCETFPWAVTFSDGELFDVFTDDFASRIFPKAISEWYSIGGTNSSLKEEIDVDTYKPEEGTILITDGNGQQEEIKGNTTYTKIIKKTYESDGWSAYFLSGDEKMEEWEELYLTSLWFVDDNFRLEEPTIEVIKEVHNINDVITFGKEQGYYDEWKIDGRVRNNGSCLMYGGESDGILWGQTGLYNYIYDIYGGEEVEILSEKLDLEPIHTKNYDDIHLLQLYIQGTDDVKLIDNWLFEKRGYDDMLDSMFEFVDGMIIEHKVPTLDNDDEEEALWERIKNHDHSVLYQLAECEPIHIYDDIQDCIEDLSKRNGWEDYGEFMEYVNGR